MFRFSNPNHWQGWTQSCIALAAAILGSGDAMLRSTIEYGSEQEQAPQRL
jgi:hypothetical protein